MKLITAKDESILLYCAWLAAMAPFVFAYDEIGIVMALVMFVIGMLALLYR